MCEEKELLVGYLYDDLAAGQRAAFESHLRGCPDCRRELHALRDVRADLASWAPPEPDFGFRVVRGGRDAAARDLVRPPIPSWRAWWTPAAGFAAAAMLVLAAASAIARVEVHSGPDGTTIRTGWPASAPSADVAAAETASRPAGTSGSGQGRDVRLSSTRDADLLAGIERRLIALEAASSRDSGARNASTLRARASDAEIVRQVRDLLARSEARQQGELALRISQVMRDVDAQRVADLSEVRKGLVNITASVRDESAAHRDLTNYILASSSSSKQK